MVSQMSDKYDRKNAGSEKQKFEADHVISYFKMEWKVLLAVTVSGLIYNLGLLAGPWFEGKMAGCLVDILGGRAGFPDMGKLVAAYVIAIAVVQSSRYIKRFYVRRFANNVNRRMKHVLYDSLVHKSRAELEEEGAGNVMTKAILDVDDCAEGMRKFTTEIFDTGVALLAYAGMLLFYDWRLALLSMLFPPVSYFLAEKMKGIVQRTGAAYKEQSGILSAATLDRASNAVTYRVYGCEQERKDAYEKNLSAYEKSAVRANIWSAAFPPIYRVISMAGVIFILYFGSKNVLGSGWRVWDVAAFTTFLTCFTKLSVKSSSAAKLFNAVHKAQVSWKRIKPLMKCVEHESESRVQKQAELTVSHLSFAYPGGTDIYEDITFSAKPGQIIGVTGAVASGKSTFGKTFHESESRVQKQAELTVSHLSFAYPGGTDIYEDITFSAKPGQIIGVTGAVASGKSTFGKTFLCEYPYQGSIRFAGRELNEMGNSVLTGTIGYLGHDPELFDDSIKNNILMGENEDTETYLKAVCFDREVAEMEQGPDTVVGSGGVRLSGGQAKRLALARTLCHKRPVLILDDPFSALDRNTEQEVYTNLKAMTSDSIVILLSHRLYLFPEMDQVIWMEHGHAAVGTHEEIMEKYPEYARLYEEQTKGSTAEKVNAGKCAETEQGRKERGRAE